jgi:S-adenosylmethionine:tRNA ribosyltransferase-isomerase
VTAAAMRFELPHSLEANRPPEDRGSVRLLVARPDGVEHARFADLPSFLRAGDLIVVNTSATLPAAVDGTRASGERVAVHFAAALDDGDWVVEVRPAGSATGPVTDLSAGEHVELPDGVGLVISAPHPRDQRRLWRAGLAVEGGVVAYLLRHGRPIRYAYVQHDYPLVDYQTVFAREPGSAEMPSAGRPFTTELITELIARGIVIAPIVLHTGVSSPEAGEPPQPERFRVPEPTARLVNLTRAWGGRVIAVGTTVTRALEAAADQDGVVEERAGWTDLVLGPSRPARVVGGLLTGWHAPGASHLDLLQAVAGAPLVDLAYRAALRRGYLWHEFGDSCLLLP